MILGRDYKSLKNMPPGFKKRINAVNMFDIDAIMRCSTAITSVKNNLKDIYLCGTIFNEFTFTYYADKNDYFEMLFQQYTDSAINKIYHPVTVE